MPYKNPKDRAVMVKRVQNRNREIIRERLSDGCQRCGFKDERALTFHHRNPADKLYKICDMRSTCYGENKLREELEKCDVLCANCHMIEHNPGEVAQTVAASV